MTMPKAVCPVCKETIYGWALDDLIKHPCPYCGAPLKKPEEEKNGKNS